MSSRRQLEMHNSKEMTVMTAAKAVVESEEEEEDYMSDAFLKKLDDVRPSLLLQHSQKRSLNMEKKKNELLEAQRKAKRSRNGEIDQEEMKKRLETPLDEDNLGFKMLRKMGYTFGHPLGRQMDTPSHDLREKRLTEPIPLEVKLDRYGLGRRKTYVNINRETFSSSNNHEAGKCLDVKLSSDLLEYRKHVRDKAENRATLHNINLCQSTCEYLDLQSKLTQPKVSWFWPKIEVIKSPGECPNESSDEENREKDTTDHLLGRNISPSNDEAEEEEDDGSNLTPEEKLETLTNYLRTTYLMCHWCSTRYNDEKDLQNNCPGPHKDDHID